jgi:hypothetical protein
MKRRFFRGWPRAGVGGATEQADRRGDALAKWRELMTAWADWLEGDETAKGVERKARLQRDLEWRRSI